MIEIRELFAEIQQEFPLLSMECQAPSEEEGLSLVIPEQPGLAFPVYLAHHGDELHLAAGVFFMEWYPAGDEDVMMSYRDATSLGSAPATYAARLSPLPPGPPGLTSSGPSRCPAGTVAGISLSARVMVRPCGWA